LTGWLAGWLIARLFFAGICVLLARSMGQNL